MVHRDLARLDENCRTNCIIKLSPTNIQMGSTQNLHDYAQREIVRWTNVKSRSLAYAYARAPCKIALFAFTTFTDGRASNWNKGNYAYFINILSYLSAARRENIEKEEAKGEKNCQSWNGTKQLVFRERRSDFEESRSKRKKRGR